ncbi:MAG: replication factor C large subunit [archaeon]
MQWTEKYRPKKFQEVEGQQEIIPKIKEFMASFNLKKNSGRIPKKTLVIHGSPGTGKTTLAYVIANEFNSEIFELNASDLRNKDKLREILKPAIEQRSLVKKSKIILIDEADGISGYYDRGGVMEMLSLIQLTSYPIIITANDIWSKKLSSLRKKSEMIQLKEINYKIIKDVLIKILRKENHFVDNDTITKIAIKSRGDLRAAINDLQSISKLDKSDSLDLDERNKEVDIFNALRLIFKGKPTNETLKIFDSVNMNIDEIILWVEENIPAEYQGEELLKAYELLGKVDVFKGRIHRQQYWRFLVYENIFLSYGIASSKKNLKTKFTSYKKPTRILKIWLNNQRTIKKKSIAIKYAKYVHISIKRAMNEFPMIQQIIKSNPKIQQELKLSEEEVEYLRR